jgi:hypothetical protein
MISKIVGVFHKRIQIISRIAMVYSLAACSESRENVDGVSAVETDLPLEIPQENGEAALYQGRLEVTTGMEVHATDGYFVRITIGSGIDDPSYRRSTIEFGVVKLGINDKPDIIGDVFLEISANGLDVFTWKCENEKLHISNSQNKNVIIATIPNRTVQANQ